MFNAVRARAARRGEQGFTLIELLIVIVILGILAAIVVFSVRGITDRGDTAACKTTISEVDVAVEAYYAQVGKYPAAMADLTTDAPTAAHPQLLLLKSAPDAKYVTAWDSTGKTAPTVMDPSGC